MPEFHFRQPIRQLEKRKGGYFYLVIDNATVDQFEKKRHVRLKCEIDHKISYSCGLNHLGDGNFFIIVATKYMKQLKKEPGETVQFKIYEDPNPLGVEEPEVLKVLLEQDSNAKSTYNQMTDGKKRSLIYTIRGTKNIDTQVSKILEFLETEAVKAANKQ
jgi:hypothetical protein